MIAAIIQARTGSKRFPYKVLKKIRHDPLIKYQIERVKKAKLIDKIIVATSKERNDDEIEKFCLSNSVEFFRGSEEDVLNRYFECSLKFGCNTIVRLTADCPIIDPKIIDEMITFFNKNNYDYISNTVPNEQSTYPDGMDVEIFSFKSLEIANEYAFKKDHREHVTHFFWQSKDKFKYTRIDLDKDLSNYRLTVDYIDDFYVIEDIINNLYFSEPNFSMFDAINFLDNNPKIKNKNKKFW